MTSSNDDRSSPKKSVTRKKLVDLKAVAALLEDGEEENKSNPSKSDKPKETGQEIYRPDEELIQETSRIKSQRDLIQQRFKKMEQSRNRVSKSVYEKVSRDYRMQLDSINELFNDKKAALNKELKKLYTLREKQTVETNRHKEILEEARFRHYLDEFSEEQFKEVEEYETREIAHLQTDLAQVNSFIRVHEELFDQQDLGFKALTKEQPKKDETKTMFPQKGQVTPPVKIAPPKEGRAKIPDEFSEKTPLPETGVETPKEKEPVTDSKISPPSEPKTDDFAPLEPSEEKGYFKTDEKGEEPESIFDVLEESPQLEKPTEPSSPQASSLTPTHISPKSAVSSEDERLTYKLVFTEGGEELDTSEMILKDNISIGRSPSNDLVLKAPKVSRQHAAINKYKDQYILIDLKSSNGVYINGTKIDEQALENGDEISIGGYKMIFQKV